MTNVSRRSSKTTLLLYSIRKSLPNPGPLAVGREVVDQAHRVPRPAPNDRYAICISFSPRHYGTFQHPIKDDGEFQRWSTGHVAFHNTFDRPKSRRLVSTILKRQRNSKSRPVVGRWPRHEELGLEVARVDRPRLRRARLVSVSFGVFGTRRERGGGARFVKSTPTPPMTESIFRQL